MLKDTNLLEGLHNLTVNGTTGIGVVRWTGTTVAGRSMDLSETSNTDSFAKVDVTGNGSGANVKPINGLRWELLCWTSLDGINPTWYVLAFYRKVRKRSISAFIPGIGSFPCLFKKAEYASMNFCA